MTAARNGASGALVVRGEPGIGKTALLGAATTELGGVRLIRIDGYEAEASMPFSALHRILMPLTRQLDALPSGHRRALRIAVGALDGQAPDRFYVGLGLLEALAAAGQSSPVVLVVDDAHWLDPESMDALAFVARRLKAEAVAMLFAMRDGPELDVRVAGIPAIRLVGLELKWAIELLRASLTESIDPLAAVQVATSTGGNPLALIDLANELSIKQLSESSLADEPVPVGHHLEEHYVRQVRQTTDEVQLWLLVAAADSTGDIEMITRAARSLEVPEDAAEGAEAAGLVELGSAVAFRHPLVRSAVYNSVEGSDRRRVHAALSRAAQELDLADQEAWHAAKATIGTDPDVADRLEQVADRAGQRGGMASRAKVLSRAAELTPPGSQRNGRVISAAEAALAAGAAQIGQGLLDGIDMQALDRVQQGRTISVQAALALFTGDPAQITKGCANMLDAAEAFHGIDPRLEQTALIRAFEYCLPTERLTQDVTLPELGRRLRDGVDVREGPAAAVLRALSAHILLPYDQAVPFMREAVDILLGTQVDIEPLQVASVGVALTTALWDERARAACLLRVADAARDAGSVQVLDVALWITSLAELSGGTPKRAGVYIEQVRELRRAIGYEAEQVVNAAYLAWVGAPREQIQALTDAIGAAGWGGVQSSAVAAMAVRDLAEGHYRDAYHRLHPLVDNPYLQASPLQFPDFVEAAVRSGHRADAEPFVEILTGMGTASNSPWAQGLAARSHALISPDDEAERMYLRAIELLSTADTEVDLARAHLLYGEWLRRLRRRREAREHLRVAMRSLDACGAGPFALRARNELEATGEHVSGDPTAGDVELTSQENTVASLAAQGRTNAEIGSAMFISVNTVDYHLRKVFQKFGISSRRQLRDRLHTAE